MSKEILINKLFSGNYLNEGMNIGHEIINMFKDDEGNNNLFVTPSGSVDKHDLEYILFVRHVSNRKTVEVIGLAKDLHPVSDEEMNRIKYADVSLDQIFRNNSYHGGADDLAHNVTFRAKSFIIPSHRVFITIDKSFRINDEYILFLESKRKVIAPQSSRLYFSDTEDSEAYTQLKDFIEKADCWKDGTTTAKLSLDGNTPNQSPTFLEVIRKEDDEVIFSNLLGYFFDYSHQAFQRFAADTNLLAISGMSDSFTVIREKMNRIDLWIESDEDIIVIENKIKSGINGITCDDYSQLEKYYDVAEAIAEKQQKDKVVKKKKNTHYYIFAPNYAKFDILKFRSGCEYKIIEYSKIYDFFSNERATYSQDRSFPDFLQGLNRHTSTSFPEMQFETMRTRLLRRINNLQQP